MWSQRTCHDRVATTDSFYSFSGIQWAITCAQSVSNAFIVEDTQLVMTDRKGFVKISIENGLDIIPGFCFGEKSVPKGVAILSLTMMTWHIMAYHGT